MRKTPEAALLVLSSRTAMDSTVRPIGEVMPVLLARYEAGPYRFCSIMTDSVTDDEASLKGPNARESVSRVLAAG